MDINLNTLTEKEVDEFIHALDKNNDAFISYQELEKGLDAAYEELAPKASSFQLHHDSKKDNERHEFLRRVLGTEKDKISVASFKDTIKSWEIPSLEPDKKAAKDQNEFLKNLPLHRRLRGYWEVHGPVYCFLLL